MRPLGRDRPPVAPAPRSWIDRALLEEVLGVGRRRAQQLLAPCVNRRIGPNVLAHLARIAAGETVHYERQRRRRLAQTLEGLRQARLHQPQLLVEAPLSILGQNLDGLPAGVSVASGRITMEFQTATEALDKLLALAMAIGNDQDRFERLATPQNTA